MAVLKIKPTPKGEGGSKVVANPELTGDEQNLEGLEVEGTKYKVDIPVKIYNHNINIRRRDYSNRLEVKVHVTIPLTKQDKLTRTEFMQYVANSNTGISATGFYSDGRDTINATRFIINTIQKVIDKYEVSGAYESVSDDNKPVYLGTSRDITSYLSESDTLTTFTDDVIEA